MAVERPLKAIYECDSTQRNTSVHRRDVETLDLPRRAERIPRYRAPTRTRRPRWRISVSGRRRMTVRPTTSSSRAQATQT